VSGSNKINPIHSIQILVFSAPWSQQSSSGSQGPSRPQYGKPSRPTSPYGSSPYGKPPSGQISYDDPIPASSSFDSSYDAQQLPSKLPILAPNGVVEIYNRVVDDLIKRLDADFKKKEIDPMMVVIRPTPAGPVRVPGHLQKRPFRRPGAALYRSNLPSSASAVPTPPRTKKARNLEVQGAITVEEKPSFRGAGKISKGPLGEEVAGVLPNLQLILTSSSLHLKRFVLVQLQLHQWGFKYTITKAIIYFTRTKADFTRKKLILPETFFFEISSKL